MLARFCTRTAPALAGGARETDIPLPPQDFAWKTDLGTEFTELCGVFTIFFVFVR